MNNNKNIETAVKENDVPIWEKKCLTLEEAAAYSGIGRNKLRELSQQKNCPFAVWLGGKLYIIREKLDDFTDKQFKILEESLCQQQKEKPNQGLFSVREYIRELTALTIIHGLMVTAKDISYMQKH